MDGDGYQELFHGQFAAMTRLAAMLGADDPEDVAQEAFVRLHRRSRTLRDPHAAVAYLRSTVVNLTRSRLRHLSVVRRLAPAPPPDVPSAEHDVVRRVLSGFEVEISDSAPGALPGLSHPAAAEFVAMVGREPLPKFGWTDVARFSALGVPAVNYGPGDPSVAHQREEYCDIAPILECEEKLLAWLS